eukprot:4534624-Prymnesium_polylepis.1
MGSTWARQRNTWVGRMRKPLQLALAYARALIMQGASVPSREQHESPAHHLRSGTWKLPQVAADDARDRAMLGRWGSDTRW